MYIYSTWEGQELFVVWVQIRNAVSESKSVFSMLFAQ